MTLTFVETTGFTGALPDYFTEDDAYRLFQEALLEKPERGAVMPGCGGLRKARWRDPRRGKGTRGGLRIIYLYVPEIALILLLDLYDKDEADDLSAEERRALAATARELREALLRRFR